MSADVTLAREAALIAAKSNVDLSHMLNQRRPPLAELLWQ